MEFFFYISEWIPEFRQNIELNVAACSHKLRIQMLRGIWEMTYTQKHLISSNVHFIILTNDFSSLL